MQFLTEVKGGLKQKHCQLTIDDLKFADGEEGRGSYPTWHGEKSTLAKLHAHQSQTGSAAGSM